MRKVSEDVRRPSYLGGDTELAHLIGRLGYLGKGNLWIGLEFFDQISTHGHVIGRCSTDLTWNG